MVIAFTIFFKLKKVSNSPKEHLLPVPFRSVEVEKVDGARHPLLAIAVTALSNEIQFCSFTAHEKITLLTF